MSLTDITKTLTSSGGPTIKLSELNVGDVVKAKILDGVYQQKTDVVTGEPLTFPDGRPKNQLVLTVRRDDDEEDHRIFLHWSAERSLGTVLKAKGLELQPGGTIAIERLADVAAEKRGMSPSQQYRADYAAPAITAGGLL